MLQILQVLGGFVVLVLSIIVAIAVIGVSFIVICETSFWLADRILRK